MWEYTDKVKEHFLHPKNVGEIPDADAVGEVGSLACGDALRLYLKVDDQGRITDARFQTFGCASAIASSSALTELVKGKTLDEALKITNKDIADYLGGLPKEKMHCSVMGREALEAAIRQLRGEAVPTPELEGELVCECFGVTDVQIRRAIEENDLKTAEDVTYYTKAGGGCGNCIPEIERILAEVRGTAPEKKAPEGPPKKLTNIERIQLIQKVIDEEIRPRLQADGGDLELVDVDRTRVYVSLRGACTHCPASELTLKDGVEKRLREVVDPEIQVLEAN
ncbi:Fe-S cluster assembly protein NifU [Dissulfurirhabdus thermomarina]|uniref:Nitrogen fixation protein NifU n=1 Tax=Dissulfurirhabdus thermomarina TaxID=1765737 RepID=A0A6N9TU98_DISTH|nr:Fe-S cluster assembly protein NifU [Dissulfurirhabdus thermomarina]NDY43017.1 Fe-S cluster assembly protein NifU [Dissulfurirhabdus thermomarina]NMX22885.1 Fe-S cluster assembly protein NifU [Dissulfurirhabdus thermomarina]